MKGINPGLSPQDIRTTIKESANIIDGFKVIDAEAAVKIAIGLKVNFQQ